MDIGILLIIVTLVAAAAAAVLIFRRAMLAARIETDSSGESSSGVPEEGQMGLVLKTLRPVGVIEVTERPYEATSEGEFIEPGADVVVIGRQGGRALVRRVKGNKE